tara:strand:+ start:294 stop:485 length:192 start_codon:yes stop_codon:yes gene_type:complete
MTNKTMGQALAHGCEVPHEAQVGFPAQFVWALRPLWTPRRFIGDRSFVAQVILERATTKIELI